MGGGASSMQGVEELLATTYMIGRAIATITFPGMYRIYDFHSSKAPKLKNAKSFSFFAPESDDEDEEYVPPDPSAYSSLFKVVVGEDSVYLEAPLETNEAGWTPLHTCCMSFLTVPAGIALINESVKQGMSLNTKTINGPGTFNRGWTPLQMACAYGVEPLVDKLVKEGADVNETNSYGYTPLLEACHRGFYNVVMILINGGARLDYLPSAEDAGSSPFVNAPSQTALGEAARCGFHNIVQALIDAGARKDQRNDLGWTPLHEACFYNRIETTKILLLSGANACLRTRLNALPYHLAGLQVLRTMLAEMGGPDAVPQEGDVVDMVNVLNELTMMDSGTSIIAVSEGGHFEVIRPDRGPSSSSSHAEYQRLLDDDENNGPASSEKSSPKKSPKDKGAKRVSLEENRETEAKLLHSGGVLGDLPSLNKSSPGKNARIDVDAALDLSRQSILGTSPTNKTPSRKADDKKKKKKRKDDEDIPKDLPPRFACQLTKRPMSDPVKTMYGNVVERTAITSWFSQQGRICPLTGAPLCETDLTSLPELGEEIRDWLLQRSIGGGVGGDSGGCTRAEVKNVESAKATSADDDLYDF